MDEDFWTMNRAIADEIEANLRKSWDGVSTAAERDGLSVSYAREIDQVYIAIGPPRQTLAFTADDDLESIIFYDPDSYEIVGIQVELFFRRLQEAQSCEPFWALIKEMIDRHGDSFFIPGKSETKKVTSALKKLAVV